MSNYTEKFLCAKNKGINTSHLAKNNDGYKKKIDGKKNKLVKFFGEADRNKEIEFDLKNIETRHPAQQMCAEVLQKISSRKKKHFNSNFRQLTDDEILRIAFADYKFDLQKYIERNKGVVSESELAKFLIEKEYTNSVYQKTKGIQVKSEYFNIFQKKIVCTIDSFF